MAFHQPTRQTFQRIIRSGAEPSTLAAVETARPAEASQTWVLFSPETEASAASSDLTSVHQSEQTPGRSRLSQGGSVNTAARSDVNSQPANSAVRLALSDLMDEDSADDDTELDSLDSHLPEFRSTPNTYYQLQASTTVLPRHDGLGSFQLDTAATALEMQEHMYAFERYNPRRIRRRRESMELAQVQLEQEHIQDLEKHQRIESWRLEHSKFLLEEVEKEARRRRQPAASLSISQLVETVSDDVATMSSLGIATPASTTHSDDWHDSQAGGDTGEPEGVWSRLTRKFMHEFMGIDDRMLSILFGEALPDEADLMSTPKASPNIALLQVEESQHDSSWRLHVLERISKELGILVNHLSAHPGAFPTYVRMQQMPLPYAGLPVIPEAVGDGAIAVDTNPTSSRATGANTPSMPQFKPTIHQMQPIDVPGTPGELHHAIHTGVNASNQRGGSFSQQEWEQELDIKLVFRYLRSRFMSRASAASATTSHHSMTSAQESAAKAARVRQHHPLVGRTRPGDRRTFRVTTPSSPVAMRHASTCASQSTRRSTRRSSVSSRHSSRHYWDLGGSMGTGSLIASAGPMGSWGEV